MRGPGAGFLLWRDSDGRPVAEDYDRDLRIVEERYGLTWIWMGTAVPLFELPVIPELEEAARGGPGRPLLSTGSG